MIHGAGAWTSILRAAEEWGRAPWEITGRDNDWERWRNHIHSNLGRTTIVPRSALT